VTQSIPADFNPPYPPCPNKFPVAKNPFAGASYGAPTCYLDANKECGEVYKVNATTNSTVNCTTDCLTSNDCSTECINQYNNYFLTYVEHEEWQM